MFVGTSTTFTSSMEKLWDCLWFNSGGENSFSLSVGSFLIVVEFSFSILGSSVFLFFWTLGN